MKTILKIETDKELDMTEVTIRVPGFQNFGQRLGELERKAFEASMADPKTLERAKQASAKVSALAEEQMKRANAKMEAMMGSVDGPMKRMIEEAREMIARSVADFGTQDEDDDEGASELEEGDFVYELEMLCVSLPEGMKWSKKMEGIVDKFLAEWPKLRPLVLKATFGYYKKFYPEVVGCFDEHDVRFILPKPATPDGVADLFCIGSIYPHRDNTIGLSGHCTWDDEHGWGILLKGNKVVRVGYASEAFE